METLFFVFVFWGFCVVFFLNNLAEMTNIIVLLKSRSKFRNYGTFLRDICASQHEELWRAPALLCIGNRQRTSVETVAYKVFCRRSNGNDKRS